MEKKLSSKNHVYISNLSENYRMLQSTVYLSHRKWYTCLSINGIYNFLK